MVGPSRVADRLTRPDRFSTMSSPAHTYDYIIVGGGSSGCVLAAHLSANPNTQVLVLEAGPDWRPIDAAAELRSLNPGRIIGREKFDQFQWPTLKAARVAGQEQRLFWRGRGLGGSSNINGMIAIRPVPDDWDRWGQPGWAHDDVVPALARIERDVDFGAQPFHGNEGPLPIFRIPRHEWGPADQALWAAAVSVGYRECEDHNAPVGTGVSPYAIGGDPVTRERITANDAWLEPVRDRSNLTVIGEALVDKVLLNGTSAVGVRVRIDGEWSELHSDEVLLAAGAVHSPAILLRSGIGPASGLPVGEGLQDHANAILFIDYVDGIGPETVDDRHTNVCVRYSSGLAEAGENDMMIIAANHSLRSQEGGSLVAWINQAFARGALRLASMDPSDHPVIEENMLGDPGDLERLRDATRRMIELTQQGPLATIARRVSLDPRGTPISDVDADQALDAWLKASASDAQHICATAAMGQVVDSDCQVYGYQSLRVIDASVFPEVPRANTHLMTLALADEMGVRMVASPLRPQAKN